MRNIRQKERQLYLIVTLLMATFLSGCFSGSISDRRIARYRPKVNDRTSILQVATPAPAVAVAVSPAVVGITPAVVMTNPAAMVTNVADIAPLPNSTAKILKRGDRIAVELRGIPVPESIKGEIDELGLNLPLIGRIKIDGKSTFEAEKLIEKAYIEGGFYMKINVIVTSQDDEYFVTGEVNKQGQYIMTGDRTLLQAITSAGGYTDFAKKSKVKVMRGQGRDKQILYFDCEKIELGKEKDPLIKPGDLIEVPRRFIL